MELMDDPVATERVEVAIVTFDSQARCIQNPINPYDFEVPQLRAHGMTELVKGVRKGIDLIEDRKMYYKDTGQNYYRPWMILMTDGEPTGKESIHHLGQDIQEAYDTKRFLFYGIGIQNYNHKLLSKICPHEVPPLPLKGLCFKEFFKWLSNSLAIVSNSVEGDHVMLPSVDDWSNMLV